MTTDYQKSERQSRTQFLAGILTKTSSVSYRTLLFSIVVVSVLLRLLSAAYQGNTISDLPGVFDQISYDGLARRVVDGYGFSFSEGHWPATRAGEPTAHWSYLYTVYLIFIYKIFGAYPLVARVIQAIVVGIFQPLFTWRIGRRLFGRTVGLIAAAISAVYIYFFYYAGGLLTESFYIVCILWVFDVAFRIVDTDPDARGKRFLWKWFELGLAVSFTVLLRQLFLLFLPFLFFWIWWNVRENAIHGTGEKHIWKSKIHWSAIKGLAMAILILIVMIIPWSVRNYRAFGTFVLLNTNAGFAFYWGNHPVHGTKFIPLLSQPYQDLIPPKLLALNEGMLDRALLQEGIKIVLNNPVRYALLSLSRVEEYFKFWPTRDSGLISNLSRVGSFGILLPFMLYGLWISFSKLQKPDYPDQRSNLLVIYLFLMVYSGIHFLTWTLIRYRLPVDAFLILFAALGIENIVNRIGTVIKR